MSTWRHFEADLHIHTALSPCGSDDMTPPAIVATALRRRLAMIAVCDHNSAGNTAAVQHAADGRLAVLAGIEIQSVEEVHVLGLFASAEGAVAAGTTVCQLLPDSDDGYADVWGEQHLLNATGDVIGSEKKHSLPRLLSTSAR